MGKRGPKPGSKQKHPRTQNRDVSRMSAEEYRAHRRDISDRCQARRLGLTFDDYRMLRDRARDGLCEICGGPPDRAPSDAFEATLHIDHDHETGAVRGLLCYKCNLAVGLFKNSPDLLRAAALYLERR